MGQTGKGQYAKKCFRCDGKGQYDVDAVIAVQKELYLHRQAEVSKRLGIPARPIKGVGVWRPGDNIPEGRDAHWMADNRATKDVFKKAYSLQFWLPSTGMLDYKPEEDVIVVSDSNGDVIEGEAVVIEEPVVEEELDIDAETKEI